ncbi:MAG: hypothetical protein H6557_15335 [Lewinellaceae bacterium]|nr:hypothetical protein [Phaeodactylibacter sp.]MCB9037988.1 hypothetical protein [Lewinellaceae bacterium]
MIVAENIKRIVQYFEEEESLYHKNIGLLSNLSNEEMVPVLACLKTEIPGVSITHSPSNTVKKHLCFPSEHDLIIQMPEGILQSRQRTFTYNFQSRLKNVFGTYEIELEEVDGHLFKGQEQLFSTSIGG